ncbi:hypothetical protein BYT27DRAFT_7114168, partial [Phlegmacium glaucopus]
ERTLFAVTGLGKQNMILGHSWLQMHSPEINWVTREIKMSQDFTLTHQSDWNSPSKNIKSPSSVRVSPSSVRVQSELVRAESELSPSPSNKITWTRTQLGLSSD